MITLVLLNQDLFTALKHWEKLWRGLTPSSSKSCCSCKFLIQSCSQIYSDLLKKQNSWKEIFYFALFHCDFRYWIWAFQINYKFDIKIFEKSVKLQFTNEDRFFEIIYMC